MKFREPTRKEYEALERLKAWRETKDPLSYSDGSPARPLKKGEKFVLVYDYMKRDLDYRYLISQYGTVVSAVYKTVYALKHSTDTSRKEGYVHVGKWLLHELIWFSFAAHSIRVYGGKGFPDFVGIVKPLTPEDLAILCTMKASEKEIHHADENPAHNELSNLVCTEHTIHNLLKNSFAKISDVEKEFKTYREISRINKNVNPDLATVIIKNAKLEQGDYYAAYSINPIEVYKWLNNDIKGRFALRKELFGYVFTVIVNYIEKDHIGYFDSERVIHLNSDYLLVDGYYVLTPKKINYLGQSNYMCKVIASMNQLDFELSGRMLDIECDLNKGILNLVQVI